MTRNEELQLIDEAIADGKLTRIEQSIEDTAIFKFNRVHPNNAKARINGKKSAIKRPNKSKIREKLYAELGL